MSHEQNPPATVRVVLCPVDGDLTVAEVTDSGSWLQGLVGGYIENFFRMSGSKEGRTIDFWADEEGKLKQRPANRYCPALRDWIVGTIVVTAADDETGETVSLTSDEASRAMVLLNQWRKVPAPQPSGGFLADHIQVIVVKD